MIKFLNLLYKYKDVTSSVITVSTNQDFIADTLINLFIHVDAAMTGFNIGL